MVLAAGVLGLFLLPGWASTDPSEQRLIRLQNDAIVVEVMPRLGGRMVTLRRPGGANILNVSPSVLTVPLAELPVASAEGHYIPFNGHVVWLGPQKDWWVQQSVNADRLARKAVWPPSPFLESGAMTVTRQAADSVRLVGPSDPVSGMRLTFTLHLEPDGTVLQEIEAVNASDRTVSWDIWPNSRLRSDAAVYIPCATNTLHRVEAKPANPDSERPLQPTLQDGFLVLDAEIPARTGVVRSGKAFVDSERPLIYAVASNDVLVAAAIPVLPKDIYPDHAAVEVYQSLGTDAAANLLELEFHSAYKTMHPGDALRFAVAWRLLPYTGGRSTQEHLAFIRTHAKVAEHLLGALGRDVLPALEFSDMEPVSLAPLLNSRWPDEIRRKAGSLSHVFIGRAAQDEAGALHVRIGKDFPWQDPFAVLYRTPYDYLPPECDAIRVRAKVVEGRFRLCLGSPTVYFGCSDVKTAVTNLTADGSNEYRDYEFSLNHGLSRNLRRAGRTKALPYVQYTRWIQEPVYLYAAEGSVGEMAVSSVRFVSRGEGRPFPPAGVQDVREPAVLADFSQPSVTGSFVSCSLQDLFPIDRPPPKVLERRGDGRIVVDAGGGKVQMMHPPPQLSLKQAGDRMCLAIRKQFSEEVAFGGLKLRGVDDANAIEVSLRADPDIPRPREVVVDILLVTSSGGAAGFDWREFAPSDEWRSVPELAFSYYLGGAPPIRQDVAFFHCRRTVQPGTWTRLLLPLRDFLCCYGQGAVSGRAFQEQAAPDPRGMVAIGFLVPFRHRQAATELSIGAVYARSVDEAAARTSFFPCHDAR